MTQPESGFTSGGIKAEPGWSFVDVPPSNQTTSDGSYTTSAKREETADVYHRVPGAFQHEDAEQPAQSPHESQTGPKAEPASDTSERRPKRPQRPRTYGPRQCRICLEIVQPSYQPPAESLPGMFQSAPRVTYDSEDPTIGRLISPCKCKGSGRYVHEGCLQQWRHADRDYRARNYWNCPTCGFKYRLQRMTWGRLISNTFTQLLLTIVIFMVAIVLLGFVADPIINLYIDPWGTLANASFREGLGDKFESILTDDDEPGWTEHLLKGLASLGLLGFVKTLLALGPWQWFNLRHSGVLPGSGRGNTGRDRVANISWLVIVLGVGTFLWAVYKGVRSFSRRTLEKASERVMDVRSDDDDDEDD